MRRHSPRFIFRILAAHGVLLLLVLALVFVAAVELFRSTRDDALAQATSRQELLASQTSHAIESFYSAIVKDLGWLQSPQDFTPSSATQPTDPAMERLELGRTPTAVKLIADQLGDRLSALFVYNKTADDLTPYLPLGSKLTAADLPAEIRSWLKTIDQTEVSHLVTLNGQAVSLIAAPFSTTPYRRLNTPTGAPPGQPGGYGRQGGPGGGQRLLQRAQGTMVHPQPRILVAAVPGDDIATNFLPLISDEAGASATLVDARMQAVTTSNRILEGINLADLDNPALQAMITEYKSHPTIHTQILSDDISTNTIKLGPRIVTLAPVDVGQSEWTLFLAYPLSDIDRAVDALFNRALFWSAFLAISITAILASTAVQMVRWRLRLERERHQVLTQEVLQARRIQEQWLPDLASVPSRMDIAAINKPANHISGDFYNWFELPDGRQAVIIGDVTGHGMAAAFLMATTQLLVRNTMSRIGSPGPAMEDVNHQLASQVFHGQFVTMLIVTLDFDRKTIEVCSAGHPQPLAGSPSGVKPLEVEGQLVLGVEKEVVYPTQRFSMADMTSLLLFTDGVLDARSPAGDRFGKDRLKAALDGHTSTAAEMVSSVTKAVDLFAAGAEPEDDITLVAINLRRVAAPSGPGPRRPVVEVR